MGFNRRKKIENIMLNTVIFASYSLPFALKSDSIKEKVK
nr:MAG TPA: hypothetical protein [Caudoviricetes sp.]